METGGPGKQGTYAMPTPSLRGRGPLPENAPPLFDPKAHDKPGQPHPQSPSKTKPSTTASTTAPKYSPGSVPANGTEAVPAPKK
jgi:hypothetical protein